MRRLPVATGADAELAVDDVAAPAGPGLPAAPDRLAVTDVVCEALRSDARASSLRRQQVARARDRVSEVQLDDAQLLEGIASSLLADTGADSGAG